MNKQPPKYPLRFFRWFCDPDYVEDIEGDLLERFEKRTNEGRAARWMFVLDILKLFRPGIIRNFEGRQQLNYYGMLKHYFLITFRNFRRQKSYSTINLVGLTVAIFSSLMIWQFIHDQKQYDNYHENEGNKYRVNISTFQNGELLEKSALTTYGLGAEAIEEVSGIKNMVRVRPIFTDEGPVIMNEDRTKKFTSYGAYYVESSFLQFFNYPLEKGYRKTALAGSNDVVLTKETAIKYFGDVDPMGETIIVSAGTFSGNFTVTGVLKELPA
ncbi:MAG: permease prefix domain 2-containing transporter [Bacteroidota bacterium]